MRKIFFSSRLYNDNLERLKLEATTRGMTFQDLLNEVIELGLLELYKSRSGSRNENLHSKWNRNIK